MLNDTISKTSLAVLATFSATLFFGTGLRIASSAFAQPVFSATDSSSAQKTEKEDPTPSDNEDPEPALRSFMRQKLDASNKILEGLVTDNLTAVGEGADSLMQMSSEAKWRVSNDVLYRRYSTEFMSAVGELKDTAQAGNADGAALAWMSATMRCLKCHEWVRNTVLADRIEPAPNRAPAK